MTNNGNLLLCVQSKDSGDEVERIEGEITLPNKFRGILCLFSLSSDSAYLLNM